MLRTIRLAVICAVILLPAFPAIAADIKPLALWDGSAKLLTTSSPQVTATSLGGSTAGISVKIKSGNDGYPGVTLTPTTVWNLSAFGRVEARVRNTGDKQISVVLRVDDDGDWKTNPWNAESVDLKAGETGTVTVRFGFSWGKPGYALKTGVISKVLLFTGKADTPRSFSVIQIQALGTPGEAPPVDAGSIRIRPKDGVLVVESKETRDADVVTSTNGAQVLFHAGAKGEQFVKLGPAQGRWDLRDYLQVNVRLKNNGTAPISMRIKLDSNRGETKSITVPAIAPGATVNAVIPFMDDEPWLITDPEKKWFTNGAASAIIVSTDGNPTERKLLIESIAASMPPAPALPDWLGQRPPVPGQWTKTLDENFDGPAIDQSKWNIYTENYWDKQSHFSKDNVILGDGVVRLRFEHKPGHENDDLKRKETDYATGFLDGYGKWTQRYGYFEARMKLPTAPGLWPAFWLMPDRGVAAGEQWKRAATDNGGMEFDIMEYLSRWGPNRYNIAQHWDGYEKNHKSNGHEGIYFQPDKDGYITAGLLWTPGEAVYYANGHEVLRWKNARISNVPSYIIFTHVSGGWDNDPLDNPTLPSDFVIDYVRCWQRADLAK